MYVCLDCGCLFRHPECHTEYHGLDSPPYEKYSCCPNCNSGAIREAIRCDLCDTYIDYNDDFIKLDNGAYICKDCYRTETYDDEY